jgi:hypothetical protein
MSNGSKPTDEANHATDVEIVEIDATNHTGLAMIDVQGQVWITFARPWWDLAHWFWWWLVPGKKKMVLLRKKTGDRVRIRACCVAEAHVRVGTKKK